MRLLLAKWKTLPPHVQERKNEKLHISHTGEQKNSNTKLKTEKKVKSPNKLLSHSQNSSRNKLKSASYYKGTL